LIDHRSSCRIILDVDAVDQRTVTAAHPVDHRGWHQLCFLVELAGDVTPMNIGDRDVIVVRTSSGLRVFDAYCPHRGAHLGHGGTLAGDTLTCPFHGREWCVGASGAELRAHPSIAAGPCLFVLLDDVPSDGADPPGHLDHDRGFRRMVAELTSTHLVSPGFRVEVAVPARYVIENAVDAAHFQACHGINNRPVFDVVDDGEGQFVVRGSFETNVANHWQPEQGADVRTEFLARIVSPGVVVTRLGSEALAPVVITAATPRADGGATVRVSIATAPTPGERLPRPEIAAALTNDSRLAFEQDLIVWEHLDVGAPERFEPGDETVLAFRSFCSSFEPRR